DLLAFIPDGRYELVSFATDEKRRNVSAYAVFHGTHTGPGGPVPPTGKEVATDYVYVMQFDGDKIRHMTKICNSGLAVKALGWVGGSRGLRLLAAVSRAVNEVRSAAHCRRGAGKLATLGGG